MHALFEIEQEMCGYIFHQVELKGHTYMYKHDMHLL